MPSDAIDLLFDWQEEREAEEPARAEGRRPDGRPRKPWPPREVTEEELSSGPTRTCSKCGVKYPETKEFYHWRRSSRHRRGGKITQSKAYWQKACRGCGRRRQDGAVRRWAKRHPLKRRWASIKGRAFRKGIEWGFSDPEDLRKFWDTPCHYCGGEVHNRLGLDRVDNDKGYIPGNVVQCCIECNQAKSTYSVDEWVDHMERVLNHLRAGQKPPDETS